MGFYEFNECSVRVFHIGETSGRFAHIETVGTVDGEGETRCFGFAFECIHALYIKAQMNETEVAPVAFFIDFTRLAPLYFHKLNFCGAKQAAETTLPWLR